MIKREMGTKNPFVRTREDHDSELAEDYVEIIHRLELENGEGQVRTSDLVRVLSVAQPTVTKALERIQAMGLVRVQPRRAVELTQEGRELAVRCLDRHDLVVEFFVQLGVSPNQANLDAEGVEHHLSKEALQAMERFMLQSKSKRA